MTYRLIRWIIEHACHVAWLATCYVAAPSSAGRAPKVKDAWRFAPRHAWRGLQRMACTCHELQSDELWHSSWAALHVAHVMQYHVTVRGPVNCCWFFFVPPQPTFTDCRNQIKPLSSTQKMSPPISKWFWQPWAGNIASLKWIGTEIHLSLPLFHYSQFSA